MKYIIAALLMIPVFCFGQDSIDPEAKIILDKISKELNSNKTIDLDFDLVIQFPGMDEDIQSGSLSQSGDKFKVLVGAQEILSNSESVYIINHDDKSAQLNSTSTLEEDQGLMNPKKMLTMYDSGDYFYAIVGSDVIDSEEVVLIEFKPKDRYSEYSKLRMAVRKADNRPVYLTLFNKDGSRFKIVVKEVGFGVERKASFFEYSKTKYPGIIVEDLRID